MHACWKSGNLNFRYSENSASLSNNFAGRDYWLQWTHNPLSKGDQRFSISVNLGTSSYYQRNLDQAILNNIKTEFASNLNYSKTFTGTPFSTNISLRHRQNVQRKELSLSLPEISWNMQRIYPLQALFAKTKWDIRQLGISHSALLRNEISNSSRSAEPAEGLSFSDLPKLIADAKNGIQHKIPVAMPLNVMRYFVLTPSFNYTELWYGKELKHTYDAQTQEIHIDTLSQFSRAGHYAFSSGLTTRLYGLFTFGKKSPLRAVRHLVTPTVSLNYRPDFSKEKHGVHRTIQTERGERKVSRYDGFLFGTTPRTSSANMTFDINNQLEIKVRDRKDTSNVDATKKIPIIDAFSLSGSYDILADSFALSPIKFGLRTTFGGRKVSLAAGASLFPYALQQQGSGGAGEGSIWRPVNAFAWEMGQGLGTLRSINASISFSLASPSARGSKSAAGAGTEADSVSSKSTLAPYLVPNVPWSMQVNYNINQRRSGRGEFTTIQSINFNGSLSLTSKTKINFSSGYDVVNGAFTQTSVSLVRDLHCWEIVGSWVPVGRFTSYSVTLRAKTPILNALRFNQRRAFTDAL